MCVHTPQKMYYIHSYQLIGWVCGYLAACHAISGILMLISRFHSRLIIQHNMWQYWFTIVSNSPSNRAIQQFLPKLKKRRITHGIFFLRSLHLILDQFLKYHLWGVAHKCFESSSFGVSHQNHLISIFESCNLCSHFRLFTANNSIPEPIPIDR